MKAMSALLLLALFLPKASPAGTQASLPLPEKIQPRVIDRQMFQDPSHVQLQGWVGSRIHANEANRLVTIDTDRLLEGYRKRPGRQAWDGEHVGKWLHAATLAWANTGDEALREKLGHVAAELCKCQLDDGYLGTYLDKDRWTEWDVWAHKYNLLGLITYARFTGDTAPLPTCRKMADLLCATFGPGEHQHDIIAAGHHMGMAPTSVLEPMVLLYRLTGEERYLAFCRYILRAWEQPNGPKIISTLLRDKRVDKVANGKAYEMLSCLNGALEFYRTTGDKQILEACLNAWQDIVNNRLYPTGAASYHELFHGDFDFPNVNNVGETCVTVTWLQFSAQLLRLTGESRFAGQLERVTLNQLFGAQKCDGSAWGYYVQMEGKKPYSSTLDGHCCLSSGPRGIALIPTFAFTTDREGVVINLFEKGSARLILPDHSTVALSVETAYPSEGRIRIKLDSKSKKAFALKLPVPDWCHGFAVRLNGKTQTPVREADGYISIKRRWTSRDELELDLKLEPRVLIGDHRNQGKIALAFGPLLLAADQALAEPSDAGLKTLCAAGPELRSLGLASRPAPSPLRTWDHARVFEINAVPCATAAAGSASAPRKLGLVAFADAGETGSNYEMWIPLAGWRISQNLLTTGNETRSRRGNQGGSINDEDFETIAVTFNNKHAAKDWFAVTMDEPITFHKIVFAHGQTFHDGGWFDTREGKPQIEIKTAKEGSWQKVGELSDYPAATATDAAGLKGGERFSWTSPEPLRAVAIRVVGKPACGDNSAQSFSSCAELQAFP